MKILIACEYSGIVRDAFAAQGHEVMSVDLLPTECNRWSHDWRGIRTLDPTRGQHWIGDVLTVLNDGWDMMIAFPPCTDLCVSGARWFKAKQADGSQQRSIDFFMALANAPIERVAIENPIGIMSRLYRKPDQIIQSWQFGHGETKATCLWLKGLPRLTPTNIVEGREARIHKMAPSPTRWKERSRTFRGIADAMATQWGRS
jgi:hypothetical protein